MILNNIEFVEHKKESVAPEKAVAQEVNFVSESAIHWIPAFAGMTVSANGSAEQTGIHRIPAFAGLTAKGLLQTFLKSIYLTLFVASLAHAGEIVDDTLQALKLDDAAEVLEGLQRGMDVNFVDEEGNTLLMLAARDGSTQSTATLINAGARTYLRNAYGDDALLLATFGGHEAVVDILLAKRATLGANAHGWTPLHYAAYAGHAALINKFLALGAQVNSQTDNGLTALMLAAKNGHIEIVRALLASKADTGALDENKLSAFDHAMSSANTNIAALVKPAAAK